MVSKDQASVRAHDTPRSIHFHPARAAR